MEREKEREKSERGENGRETRRRKRDLLTDGTRTPRQTIPTRERERRKRFLPYKLMLLRLLVVLVVESNVPKYYYTANKMQTHLSGLLCDHFELL